MVLFKRVGVSYYVVLLGIYNITKCFQVLDRIGLDCPDMETLCIKDQALTSESLYS